jgi:N-acetyl-anhydromuramyl-L-alanine amidase AmpD
VIHATATAGKDSPLEWLCDKASKVSAHYLIDCFGTIYHLVHEQNVAWHAGESEWDNKPNVNHFSVGIELVNANDGKMPYTDAQVGACADLVGAICNEHGIAIKDVVGHKDIAPGRKTDPAGFPWDDFKLMLSDRGLK